MVPHLRRAKPEWERDSSLGDRTGDESLARSPPSVCWELRSSREQSSKNGVKNLKGAQATPEFQSLIFFAFTVKLVLDNHPEEKCQIKTDRSAADIF